MQADTSAIATEKGHFRTQGVPGAYTEDELGVSQWFVRTTAIDLDAAQVANNDALIVTPPLPFEIATPAKIEVWRYPDDRMKEIRQRLGKYVNRADPRLAWEPVPDESVLNMILERLNPWSRQLTSTPDWEADALLSTLPEGLRDQEKLAPYLSAEALASLSFSSFEVRLLQQAVWMRDISEWARG